MLKDKYDQLVKRHGFVNEPVANSVDLRKEIGLLKQAKNAVILGHYYITPELQDLSDFLGDSLALAQQAEATTADIILFVGVHFMAETAKILNPGKKVIIPDLNAGCSLADSTPGPDFERFVRKYPEHVVISYINCSAEVKALSDVIVTSSNAKKIVESFRKIKKSFSHRIKTWAIISILLPEETWYYGMVPAWSTKSIHWKRLLILKRNIRMQR